jgi:hypothetical protein
MKTPLDEELIPILSKYLYSQICLSKMKTPLDEELIPIMEVSFIGGGNQSTQRKPLTSRKSLTNFIT